MQDGSTAKDFVRVDANYRFIAAYQEVNARVAQRQQALGLYVSLVVSLLAARVAGMPRVHDRLGA